MTLTIPESTRSDAACIASPRAWGTKIRHIQIESTGKLRTSTTFKQKNDKSTPPFKPSNPLITFLSTFVIFTPSSKLMAPA
jgi:hypothetical protein